MKNLGERHPITQRLILAGLALLIWLAPALTSARAQSDETAAQPDAPESSGPAVLLGVYPEGYINATVIADELVSLENWTGKQVSLAAIEWDLQETSVAVGVPNQLNLLWNSGYTPFINLAPGFVSQPTAAQIAGGQYDSYITAWGQMLATWTGQGRFVFLAPLPEMNVSWKSYSMDPANYIAAFQRFRDLFTAAGVQPGAVRWVFAPNGWFNMPFDAYYPGNDLVDVAAFSVYNFGYCAGQPNWKTPQALIAPSLQTMRTLAPGKPVIVSRIGTTSIDQTGQPNADSKNQWLRSAYAYLITQPEVAAVVYDNRPGDCFWPMYKKNDPQVQYAGFIEAAGNPAYGYISPANLRNTSLARSVDTVYLPNLPRKQQYCASDAPMLSAAYSEGWPGLQETMDNEFRSLDAWAQDRVSIVGTYIDFEVPNDDTHVRMQLETIWRNGYTPFVNIPSTRSAYQIASGTIDNAIRNWARAYKQYALGEGGRMAFLAPLQEMNGGWVPYGKDAGNFKLAYARIQQIFAAEGVPAASVKWVFAPNGYGDPGHEFENYYPGDSVVDIVAFSSYNFGYHPNNRWKRWETAAQIYKPYLDRMRLMAPTKPIMIAQTATTGYTSSGFSAAAKNDWLRNSYAYLETYPAFMAVIYQNEVNEQGYDWPFFALNPPLQMQGYADALASPTVCYVTPQKLMQMDLSVYIP